jgi:hypothetical protein
MGGVAAKGMEGQFLLTREDHAESQTTHKKVNT